MAEHELLAVDGPAASRWRPVRQRIASGVSLSDCFADVEEQFYKSLQAASRLWAKQCVSLERMLTTALNNPRELEALVRQVERQEHALVLREVVRCQQHLSLEQLVLAWLSAVWDSIRDQLQLDIHRQGPDTEFDERIRSMLKRSARLIAGNPARIPNRPARPKSSATKLNDILTRSLL